MQMADESEKERKWNLLGVSKPYNWVWLRYLWLF